MKMMIIVIPRLLRIPLQTVNSNRQRNTGNGSSHSSSSANKMGDNNKSDHNVGDNKKGNNVSNHS